MNEIAMHLVGNVASDVRMTYTRAGVPIASFRIAIGSRRYDKARDQWVDGETSFLTVKCWRELARNVEESITKGLPVIVFGKLVSRQADLSCGDSAHAVWYHDVEASSVGIDLARGVATFTRMKRDSVLRQEQRAIDEAMAVPGSAA